MGRGKSNRNQGLRPNQADADNAGLTAIATKDEADAFRQSIKDAKILAQDTVTPHTNRPRPVPKQTIRDENEIVENLLSEEYLSVEQETGDELMFLRAGLQKNILRKLRRGEFSVTSELDLHGYNVANARDALVQFLHFARRNNQTCVRIIHGKGKRSPGRQPVLKNKVHGWLCQRDEVLAACVAPNTDGGAGAVYVLLKRR